MKEKETKAEALNERIEKIKEEINNLKEQVVKHPNDKALLQRYKNKKNRLYSWQQRKQRFENDINKYKTDKTCLYNMCFGSKREFGKQYHLDDNGYKTHNKWLNDFRKSRDRQVYYIGSSDETCGNQLCQLEYIENTNRFMLKVRKEQNYCKPDAKKNDRSNYVWLDIDFKYRILLYALKNNLALTYTIIRKGRKWYIDAAIKVSLEQEIKEGI